MRQRCTKRGKLNVKYYIKFVMSRIGSNKIKFPHCPRANQLKYVIVLAKGDLHRQGAVRVLRNVLHSRGSACYFPAKGRCLQERIRGPEVVGSTAPAITQTCMAIPISSSTRDRVENLRVC